MTKRCKRCKRVISDRGRPNTSGFCSNCYKQSDTYKAFFKQYQEDYKVRKQKEQVEKLKKLRELRA